MSCVCFEELERGEKSPRAFRSAVLRKFLERERRAAAPCPRWNLGSKTVSTGYFLKVRENSSWSGLPS